MELVTSVPWRTSEDDDSEDDDKVDGEKFAKLQVLEEAIRKHDEDVKKEREMAHESMPRSMGTAELPRMRVSHPRDHPPGALHNVQDEIVRPARGQGVRTTR